MSFDFVIFILPMQSLYVFVCVCVFNLLFLNYCLIYAQISWIRRVCK